jgi:hypothetical protein
LGTGVLSSWCAAHGKIGSSIHDFEILARTVIGMLMREPASEAEAVALLRAEIERSACLP